ncbi:MAG: hypothetical protein OQK69_02835 [Gammaproteobacteria bacterium]|nr:hypothetical protein [Gammaproteobacteria bacterium]
MKNEMENKYKKGSFGYWWTVTMGREDIRGKGYMGSINCFNQQLTTLYGAPNKVDGSFLCVNNQLTSLKYAPKTVRRAFDCSYNQLTSLKYAPRTVGDSFFCRINQLTTLEGAPETVGYVFDCSSNHLTNLEYAPKTVLYNFYCFNNHLTSLEGAPTTIDGDFYCYNNQLISLEYAPETVGGGFLCANNQLTTLPDDFPHINKLNGDIYKYQGELWSFFDGIKKKVIKHRKNIYYLEGGIVCIYHNGVYAHGENLKEAREALIYKFSNRDTSKYNNMKLDTILTFEQAIEMYHAITGACSLGIRDFVENRLNNKKKEYSIKDIIEITKGEYNNNMVLEFFKK